MHHIRGVVLARLERLVSVGHYQCDYWRCGAPTGAELLVTCDGVHAQAGDRANPKIEPDNLRDWTVSSVGAAVA